MSYATTDLHTVAITGDIEHPRIDFSCHGGRDATCHSYPDCDCESYTLGASVDDAGHLFVAHDDCWMKSYFDNADVGGVDPMPDQLAESELMPGMSGPIETYYNDDHIEWEFINKPLLVALSRIPENGDTDGHRPA